MNLVLPTDIYTVTTKSIITELDCKLVILLYQPIIGSTASSFYLTLKDELERCESSKEFMHHHLMNMTQRKLDELILMRERLEAVGLLKTYLKKGDVNKYMYVLFAPLTAKEFFNHPILNISLYNNIGKTEYDSLIEYFKEKKIIVKDMEDISKKFSEVFTMVPTKNIENMSVESRDSTKIKVLANIDINFIIESIPKDLVNSKCFSDEVLELITNLSYIYNLDNEIMTSIIIDSLDSSKMIDKVALRKNCRNYYRFENNGILPTLVYSSDLNQVNTNLTKASKREKLIATFNTTSPYDFLASKCKSGEPSLRDLRLIEELIINFKLNYGVTNTLIAYVLHINNNKLSKNYVEAIAGQWQRLNIKTVEEALELTEKEYKKKRASVSVKKDTKKHEEIIPTWFNKEIESTVINHEEEEEMKKLLEEMS